MSTPHLAGAEPRKALRLWPGVVIAVLALAARFLLPALVPGGMMFGVLGMAAGGLLILLWWLLLSRAPWAERLGALVVMAVALAVSYQFIHVSIANGAMGRLFWGLSIPTLMLVFVVVLAATRTLADGPRRAAVAAAIVLACGSWTLLRTGGFTSEFKQDLHWRWTPTPEDRLLASGDEAPAVAAPAPEAPAPPAPIASASAPAAPAPVASSAATAMVQPASLTIAPLRPQPPAEWPGFRGPERNGVVRAAAIATDWSATPPTLLWRRAVGPGWSSFAVRGDLFYTQEQRGGDEVVACYRASTGAAVWRHRDPARFWESNGGAGPRGTPTLSNGRVYAFGATGVLNSLDAVTGAVAWSRNVATDASRNLPGWGFSASPLVVGDLVVVAAGGRLAAYDAASGELRWLGPDGGGYSSPQLAVIGGVPQVVQLSSKGAVAVAPADGKVLWQFSWEGMPIVQPAVLPDGDLLVSTTENAMAVGVRRLAVSHGDAGWTAAERWMSTGLKPYFNDLVLHKGHAYGFDNNILACIDLADGSRKWKGGRYGSGQLVLLPEQDLLLVVSEEGDLALVKATPDQFTEVTRVPALEGKTWNHPVVVGNRLLVRNGEQMAAFQLPTGR